MTNQPAFTRRQREFLRLLLTSGPNGLEPHHWPSPIILRRWLRNDTFRQTLIELRDTYRFQTDLYLAGASARAASSLESQLAEPADGQRSSTADLLRTISLANVRQRFERKSDSRGSFPPASWTANQRTAFVQLQRYRAERERREREERAAWLAERRAAVPTSCNQPPPGT